MLSKLFLITSLGLCTSASAAPVLNFNESTGQSALPYAGTAGWLFYRNAAVSGDLTITGLSYWDANLNGLARFFVSQRFQKERLLPLRVSGEPLR
jgi:hypothetical protein